MTHDEILKFIRIDITNMQKEIQSLKYELARKNDYIMANIKQILKRQEASLVDIYFCKRCNGHGTIYISPISDCGQSNVCSDCHGTGAVWA